jgi:hypothetical protein
MNQNCPRNRALSCPQRPAIDAGGMNTPDDPSLYGPSPTHTRTVRETGGRSDDRITLQYVQTGNAPFNAALIGWVEANRHDDVERNRLCPPNGFTSAADARNLARQWATTQRAATAWSAEPDLRRWLSTCRLSPLGNARPHLDDPAIDAIKRTSQHRDAAIENLGRLLSHSGVAPT